MTEEENKAIKSMKRFVECRQDMTAVTASEMKTVLDLLEKKDRTIQQLKDENKTLNRQAQQYFETTIIQSQQYDKERTKKDKIIDEMARAIDNYDSQLVINTFKDKEHVKQYFKEKVENGN